MESLDKDQILSDVKGVISNAEDLLKEAATASGEQAQELREKALVALRRAREGLVDAQHAVVDSGRAAARVTDDFVHEHPWRAVGLAAAAGFFLGLLVNRR